MRVLKSQKRKRFETNLKYQRIASVLANNLHEKLCKICGIPLPDNYPKLITLNHSRIKFKRRKS